jgi:hypothetical protein
MLKMKMGPKITLKIEHIASILIREKSVLFEVLFQIILKHL